MRVVDCIIRCHLTLLVLALAAPHDALTRDRTPQEMRGEQIYTTGTSESGGEITALFGAAGTAIPAQAAPCANCHGMDGRGRPEGGSAPPISPGRH